MTKLAHLEAANKALASVKKLMVADEANGTVGVVGQVARERALIWATVAHTHALLSQR